MSKAKQKPVPADLALNAVIYARYSSHSQSEQSIDGQLADCHAYAERNHFRVVGEYIDRALTGTRDNRPDFQRMIKDAEKRQFSIILVWKLDRFARNRYDSAYYKAKLRKYGVRVISVMEAIPDSPEGIILEGLLESMAEFYSANLAENIRRGQRESVKAGHFLGGTVPFGYIVKDKRLVADERTAPVIREIYRRYAAGERTADIARDLNARGFHTRRGYPFTVSSFDSMIPNPAYIGEYTYAGAVIPGLSEPLLDREVYDAAIRRREANRRAPAARLSPADYVLQGKIFCGSCGMPMAGESGRSKSGKVYYYYKCSGHKNRTNDCKKKAERKDFIEWYVCEQTINYVLIPDHLDIIAEAVVDIHNRDTGIDSLAAIETTLKRINADLNALVDSIITMPASARPRIAEKMELLEAQRLDAEADLAKLRIQHRITLTKKQVAAWLKTFSGGDLMDPVFRQRVIETFINSVYLYDEKTVIFFNLREGQETAYIDPISELDELAEDFEESNKKPSKGSSLEGGGGPFPIKLEHNVMLVFVHGLLGLVIFA